MNQRHTDHELLAIYKVRTGREVYSNHFIKKYHQIFNDAEEDPTYFEEGKVPKDMVLWHSTNIFLDKFIELVDQGHDPFWATLIADNSESDDLALGETYEAFNKSDQSFAEKQLIVFCKARGEDDEVFHKYFIDQFKEREYYDAFLYTKNFYKGYKKQIDAGRSELFARTYGEASSTSEFREIYCFVFAEKYELKLEEGWSEIKAYEYANDYGQMIANNYRRYSDIAKDPDLDIVVQLWKERNGHE